MRGKFMMALVIMEAAPRFELGVKDLQSSALPLGYTAFVLGTLHILVRDDYFVKPLTFALVM